MQYFYEAFDSTGNIVVGKVEGATVEEVRARLLSQGYNPRSLAPDLGTQTVSSPLAPQMVQTAPLTSTSRQGGVILAGNAARHAKKAKPTPSPSSITTPHPPPANASSLGGVSHKEMLLFFQQCASLVRSGFTLYATMENLSGRTANPNLRKAVGEMALAAHRGQRVSDVMAIYPRIFPEHTTGMVRAGELGGFVEIALEEIALDYEQKVALYRGAWLPKWIASMAYFSLPIGIPFFSTLFRSLDFAGNMILYFKLVFFLYLPIFTAIYVGIILGARHLQHPKWRSFRDKMLLKTPPYGTLQRQVALGNFVRMLRRLYRSGVAPIHAWEGAMHTAHNFHLREKLAQSYALMQAGVSMGEAFVNTRLFDTTVEQLIITGEQSGELDIMLDRAAEFYQMGTEEAHKRVRFAMMRLGCFAMLVLSGFLICWLAKSYFTAVFNLPKAMFPELDQ
jgi:type IV pilus assembly protein PilC